jgi:hypothetical protein
VPTLPTAPAPIVPAAPPANEPDSQTYEFVLGFADLKGQMGGLMGDPVEAEHGNDDNCDTQQLTTTGLAYWRCSTNVTGFTSFPDGVEHWALAPQGLLEWASTDADPPSDAALVVAAQSSGDDPGSASECLSAASVTSLTCAPGAVMYAMDTLQNSGDTDTFLLNVPPNGLAVSANLVDLPADYDLFLADSSGAILGESTEEGTAPEHIDAVVDGGTYYLYVHSDLSRAVDPQNAFRLEVSLSSAVATAAVP